MIYSVEEIDMGMLAEGLDELMDDPIARDFWEEEQAKKKALQPILNAQKSGYGYWLDNCGDGEWYCQHCLQPECLKRMAKRI